MGRSLLKIIEAMLLKQGNARREGELIFRLTYNLCKCTKPVKRLWISSMEESAIRKSFDNLADGEQYDNLYAAALCRAKADWLIGINGTRLFTTLYREYSATSNRLKYKQLKMKYGKIGAREMGETAEKACT